MKYAVIEEAGRIVIREKEAPRVAAGKLLVRVTRAGVCGATELHFLRGEAGVSFPLDSFNSCFGHEGSGVVEEAGAGVEGFEKGARVTYLGPCYTEYALVDPALAARLPGDVSFDDILGEPFAVVLHTLEHAQGRVLGDVVLLGAGFMGLLVLQGLVRMPLRRVIVAEKRESRLRLAREFGATSAVKVGRDDLEEAVMRLTDGRGADVVIEASGSKEALKQCGALVAPGGKIVLHGYYPGLSAIDLGPWHVKGAVVINSHPHDRERYGELMQRACTAAREKFFDLSRIVTHRLPLEELSGAFEALVKDEGLIKAVIQFD
ncbi:MAG: zinc-binding dehydrogenase [Planctomycetota bacterium]